MYKQHCRDIPPPLEGPLADTSNTATDSPHHNNPLYCGYCNILCETPAGLAAHCKQDPHKYAVFADSGRDVLWEFELPPAEQHNISAAIYG